MKKLLAALLLFPSLSWGALTDSAPVQCVEANSPTATSLNPVIAAPTVGNLLTYHFAVRKDGGGLSYTMTIDSDFTEVEFYRTTNSFQSQGSVGFGEADGTTSFTFSTSVDVGEIRVVVCEWPYTSSDLVLSAVDASGENTSEVADFNATTFESGSATPTTTDALLISTHMCYASVNCNLNNVTDQGTIRRDADSDNRPAAIIVSDVVSVTTAQEITVTSGDDQANYGTIMVFAEAASATTLDDETPVYGQSVNATFDALPGAATKMVFSNGDEVTCDTGTTTSCDFTLPFSGLVPSGVLDSTEPEILYTISASDGTNSSASANITVGYPNAADAGGGVIACTAGVNCPANSEFAPPVASGDKMVYNFTPSTGEVSLYGAVNMAGNQGTVNIYVWDDNLGVWLDVNTVVFDGSECGVIRAIQSPVFSPFQNEPIRVAICI